MSPLEKMARAIVQASVVTTNDEVRADAWAFLDWKRKEHAIEVARAALLAIREPDHAVVRAMAESEANDGEGGHHAPLCDLVGFSGENATRLVLAEAFRCGIDAILNQEPRP